ncbi:MAG TPA: ABC transporter permease [Thermoanaerobaculia bacterium]|nr:ABC transporter permease [Thermoanaerobaculia bacterium]
MSAVLPAPPVTYDSAKRGLPFVSEALALWDFRHLVAELVSRDIKVRYKRSVLGIAWTMLSPLVNMVALTIVFSEILKQQITNFPVYLLTGSLLWTFFSQGTSYAASLTVDAGDITRRVYVPRSVFVAVAVGVALVNLLLSLVPLFVIILVTRHPVSTAWLFLPVPILVATIFTAGVGLLVFTMSSRFVDVKETYMVLLGTWFFITPVFYVPAIVPERFRWIITLNPMTHLLNLFRAPLYEGRIPGARVLLLSVAAALVALAAGWLFYARKNEDYGTRS